MRKLEKILFYLLIFSLPFETRLILYQWGSEFNEWTSAFLYLTDLLIIGLLFFWVWRVPAQGLLALSPTFLGASFLGASLLNFLGARLPKRRLPKRSGPGLALVAFLLVAFISLIQANNFWLGFYQWLKLLEFAFLFFYLRYNFKKLFSFKRTAQVFIASGLFQSIIAISQYVSQASLGLWWFRESLLSPDLVGVAKIVVNGTKMIRAYATFPHSNVLAAFLLAALFFLYWLWLKNKIHYSALTGIFGLLFFAFFLTFSRTIIFVFLSATLLYFGFFFKKSRKKIIFLFLLFSVLCSLFSLLAWPELSSRFSVFLTEPAVSLRAFYNETAFLLIKGNPFLGIGLGNFVWEIKQTLPLLASWLHQPVHNIYLLIIAETGLIGFILFLFFIFSILKEARNNEQRTTNNEQYYSLMFIILCSLFIAFFDHFFWTLQQGQLIFWILLGILASRSG